MHRSIETILNRRAILTAAAAAPLTLAIPATAATPESPYTAAAVAQRVNDFAKLMEVSPTKVSADADGIAMLSDDLISWCGTHGASIDWIAAGDASAMMMVMQSSRLAPSYQNDPVKPLLEGWNRAVGYYEGLDIDVTPESDLSAAHMGVWGWIEKLCQTAPTSASGLAAYLDFVRQHFLTDEGSNWDGDVDAMAVANASRCATALAGGES